MREQRILVGMSQQVLAEQLGITFQQLQKNERGANRISAGRLFQISQILEMPIPYFFDGLDPRAGRTEAKPDESDVDMSTRETLALVRAFHRVHDPDMRKLILNIIQGLTGDRPARDMSV